MGEHRVLVGEWLIADLFLVHFENSRGLRVLWLCDIALPNFFKFLVCDCEKDSYRVKLSLVDIAKLVQCEELISAL